MNKDVVLEFLEETLSGFDTIENTMIELEDHPNDMSLIDTIFRPVHSLKGNSAFFGLLKVKKLTHRMENLLDSARKEKLMISSEIISLLLECIDYLREIINRVEEGGEEVIDEKRYNEFLDQLNKIIKEQEKTFPLLQTEKAEIIAFLDNLKNEEQYTEKVHTLLSIFEKNQEDSSKTIPEIEILENYFANPFDDGEASEDIIDDISNQLTKVSQYVSDNNSKKKYDDLLDTYKTFADSGVGIDEIAQEILADKLASFKSTISIKEEKPKKDDASKLEKQVIKKEKAQPDKKKKQSKSNTIRINEQSLDQFLNYVGELLSIEELFGYISQELVKYDINLTSTFKHNLDNFSRISSKLRNSIMEVRKVKSDSLLGKSKRIVRDIAKKSKKEINIEIRGKELKIDKSYIELLDSPLVHMIRNAADHGIESPREREQSGKEKTGTIIIGLKEDEKNLILQIIDDGRGLDLKKLRQKAMEKGLIDKTQDLTENDIINLLFQSGVSTAQKVTDVSGRGVGMDVVRKAIDDAGGNIKVKTEPGKGSTFSVILPKNVSTKISDVYLVEAFSGDYYALPLKLVEEAFTIDQTDIFSVKNKGNVIKRRGNILSVFVLDEVLRGNKDGSIGQYFEDRKNIPFVYVNIPGKPIAICLKDVIGVQTIVVKDIESIKFDNKIFDGGSTQADGKIALILNQDWLEDYIKSS